MAETTVRIRNKLGLHARPAALVVQLASKFKAEIFFSKDSMVINGKSIMGVMMLAAECGSSVLIQAQGEDAPQAVRALVELIESGFGEELADEPAQDRRPKG